MSYVSKKPNIKASIWCSDVIQSSDSMGPTDNNSLKTESGGDLWVEVGTDALPVATYAHTSVVFNGKMWVIGGSDGSAYIRKVYSSSDGITWTEAGTDALPVATHAHTSVVFNGKMWVMGGYASSGYVKKVYYSSDGITWTEVGTSALPVAVYGLSSVVFNGKMWIMGGYSAAGSGTKKVHSSTDGITWTEAGTDAIPVDQYGQGSVVYNGKMWMIGGNRGGGPSRRVYSSINGATWTDLGDALPVASAYRTSVFNGKMWAMGGFDGSAYVRKVYSSSDGITWTEAGTNALPVTISQSSNVVFNGKMWMISGETTGGSLTRKVYCAIPEVKSGLQLDGQISFGRTVVSTTPYNALTTDSYIAVTLTGAAKTINLPALASVGIGRRLIIKDEGGDAGTYSITVDGSGAENIDGSGTFVINSNYGSITIISNGTSWSMV